MRVRWFWQDAAMTSSELIALARRIAVARQASAARFRELDTLTPGRQAPTWIIDTELAGRDHAEGQIELAEDEDPDLKSARLAELFEPLPIEWITHVPTQEEARSLVEAARSDDEIEPIVDDLPGQTQDSAASVQAELGGEDALLEPMESPGVSSGDESAEDGALEASTLEREAHAQALTHSAAGSIDGGDELSASTSVSNSAAEPAPVLTGIDEATHEAAVSAARQAGYEEGLAAARAELLASVEAQRAELANLVESFREQTADAAKLFEPLKRLSLHLAQELVRGELNLSGDAIARLVDACLLEIDRRTGRDLVLSLHPADLERWRTHAGTVLDGIETRSDSSLSRGSVRLAVGEAVIEDLIENRLQTLSRQLLGDAHAWRGAGAQPRTSLPLARTDGTGLSADTDVVDVG
jgi:flagellar biosynthesis/type III secretory pathway protein FliH